MNADAAPLFDSRMPLAIRAARSAGIFLKNARRDNAMKILEASRRDIKIKADRAVENLIRDCLGNALPILGEEAGWSGVKPEATDHWVVDGLDGTVNFAFDIPLSAVSIGLIRDGRPYLGVVYDFIHDELFVGEVGVGAVLNDRPIRVSNTAAPASALLLSAVAASRDFSPESLAAFGIALGRWRKVRMLGSASISLAYVAAGRADVCEIAGIMEWDVAAGLALVEAAGGQASMKATGAPCTFDVYAHNGLMAQR